jgi:membrane protease YdiL (CAAX protease family)
VKHRISFLAGCGFEVALLGGAFAWGWIFGCAPFADASFGIRAATIGVAAAIPPFCFFYWTLRSGVPGVVRHRQMMEEVIRPLLGSWSVVQLAVISLFAGVCEEALFRGAIQGSLTQRMGTWWALILASMAFGAAHLITWTYAIIVVFIGLYLGLLWLWTGNLVAPITAHAVYDFVALVYFLRFYRGAR